MKSAKPSTTHVLSGCSGDHRTRALYARWGGQTAEADETPPGLVSCSMKDTKRFKVSSGSLVLADVASAKVAKAPVFASASAVCKADNPVRPSER